MKSGKGMGGFINDKEIYIKYSERLPFSERKGNGAGRSFKESAERGGMESRIEESQTSEKQCLTCHIQGSLSCVPSVWEGIWQRENKQAI